MNFKSFLNPTFRLGSHFDNVNAISAVSVVGFALFLVVILFDKGKLKYLFLLPLLLVALVGFSTGSRTFAFAIIIVLLVTLFFKFKRHKVVYLSVVFTIFVIGVIILSFPFMTTIRTRIIDAFGTLFGFGTKTDTSTIERVLWTQYSFSLGSKNMIFGYGANGFSIISGVGTYSHSNYGEVFCNFGLFGFLLFYLPLLVCLVESIRLKRFNKCFIITFCSYYFLVSLSNVFYYNKNFYLILAFMYYLSFGDSGRFVNTNKFGEENDFSKLKICFCVDQINPGGAERVIVTLANEFCSLANDVSFIETSSKTREPFYTLDAKIKHVQLLSSNCKKIGFVKKLWLLKKELNHIKPDIVVSFKYQTNILCFFATLFTEFRHIVSERNNPYLYSIGRIGNLLKKPVFWMADGCVFQTPDALHYYFRKPNKKTAIIGNPVFLNSNPIEECEIKDKTILFVGRLEEQKNVYLLIDSFAVFSSKFTDYNLKIYGDGLLKEKLIKYAESLKLSEKIHFCGNNQNWHTIEKKASMFVLSSDFEGMPNALMEAMALGIPSISTDCPIGGPRELITDKKSGFLVPVGDTKSIAKKMEEIAVDNNLSNLFYKNTRFVLSKYSSQNIARQWFEYIKLLLVNSDEFNDL